jgi:hypothetical protein
LITVEYIINDKLAKKDIPIKDILWYKTDIREEYY